MRHRYGFKGTEPDNAWAVANLINHPPASRQPNCTPMCVNVKPDAPPEVSLPTYPLPSTQHVLIKFTDKLPSADHWDLHSNPYLKLLYIIPQLDKIHQLPLSYPSLYPDSRC